MQWPNFHLLKGKKLRPYIVVCIAVVVTLLAFGMSRIWRARFSYQWSRSYHGIFGNPVRGLVGDFSGRDFISNHGVLGVVVRIDGPAVVMRNSGNTEQTVLVSDATLIRRGRKNVTRADIAPGLRIVVIGSPDADGRIAARFIRILNPIPSGAISP
jgi:hypothetical protein